VSALLVEAGELAWSIIVKELGRSDGARDTSCLHFAAAAAAPLRGTGWRFTAGGAFLRSARTVGWGLIVDPRTRTYSVTADLTVNIEDGSYCGHCWLQAGPRFAVNVIDIMDGYAGPRHDATTLMAYHALPTLVRSIRAYHAADLKRVSAAARRHAEFCRLMTEIARKEQ
jgi:hypothetical protein